MIIFSVFGVILSILFLALLVFGLILTRKQGFMEGFYFFLLMIIEKVFSYFVDIMFGTYIRGLQFEGSSPPLGMSLGEWITYSSIMFKIISVTIMMAAVGILLFGLNRVWQSQKAKL